MNKKIVSLRSRNKSNKKCFIANLFWTETHASKWLDLVGKPAFERRRYSLFIRGNREPTSQNQYSNQWVHSNGEYKISDFIFSFFYTIPWIELQLTTSSDGVNADRLNCDCGSKALWSMRMKQEIPWNKCKFYLHFRLNQREFCVENQRRITAMETCCVEMRCGSCQYRTQSAFINFLSVTLLPSLTHSLTYSLILFPFVLCEPSSTVMITGRPWHSIYFK